MYQNKLMMSYHMIYLASILYMATLALCLPVDEDTCSFFGQCSAGMGYIDSFPTSDEHECSFRCSSNQQCQMHTYYSDLGECWLLSRCDEILEANCLDCSTSHVSCRPPEFGEKVCGGEFSRCEGPDIDIQESPHVNECRSQCLEHPDCLYYSYDNRLCVLTAECGHPYEDGYFDSWERDCPFPSPQDKMVILGGVGQGGTVLSSVEVVDLSLRGGESCSMPDYPAAVQGVALNYDVDYSLLACGGTLSNGSVIMDCLPLVSGDWSPSSTTAILDTERSGAVAVMLDRTRWWLTGGGIFELTSTVTLTRGYGEAKEAFEQATSLPAELREHNVVVLKDSGQAVILNGGQEKVWLANVQEEQFTYEELPDNPSPRMGAFAGLVTTSNGARQLVFAGGYPYDPSTWILDLETLTWEQGPDFPNPSYRGASVPISSWETFLAVGGQNEDGQPSQMIYKYDPETQEWEELSAQLNTPRYAFAAAIIAEDYCY